MKIGKTFKKISGSTEKVIKGVIEILEDLFKVKKISKTVFNTAVGILNVFLLISNFLLEKFNQYWIYIPFLTLLILFLQTIKKLDEKRRINTMISNIQDIRNSLVKKKAGKK